MEGWTGTILSREARLQRQQWGEDRCLQQGGGTGGEVTGLSPMGLSKEDHRVVCLF